MANPIKPSKPSNQTTPEAFISEVAPATTAPTQEAPALAIPEATPAPASPAQAAVDPFVLVSRNGSTGKVARTIRAMAVPGGVVLKSTFALFPDPVPRGEALCFVPGVEIKDIQAMLP